MPEAVRVLIKLTLAFIVINPWPLLQEFLQAFTPHSRHLRNSSRNPLPVTDQANNQRRHGNAEQVQSLASKMLH